MLLFIETSCSSSSGSGLYFNTSHVTVYRFQIVVAQHRETYFNTSHVTVYLLAQLVEENKYLYFNTSHVTVYHLTHSKQYQLLLFQYISCYCLSCVRWFCKTCKQISIHLMLLFIHSDQNFLPVSDSFQYISCYCLSLRPHVTVRPVLYFNTSHVTVYQILTSFNSTFHHISIHLMLLFIMIAYKIDVLEAHFNTSHVTVYRKETTSRYRYRFISIHLMLLFIFLISFVTSSTRSFQYISCYCLSV